MEIKTDSYRASLPTSLRCSPYWPVKPGGTNINWMIQRSLPRDWELYKIVVESRCFAAARAKCEEMIKSLSTEIREGTDRSLRTSGTLREMSENCNKALRNIQSGLDRSLSAINKGTFRPPHVRYWHVDENDQEIDGSRVELPWQEWIDLYPPFTEEITATEAS
jgi:hypothetical protein